MGSAVVNTFVVSGRMRSGTSMMMNCCAEGGLTAMVKCSIADLIREERRAEHNGDYAPNPDGYFEHPMLEYRNMHTDGLVCKVLANQLKHLPEVYNLRYKIVFMVRPKAEILISAKRAFNEEPQLVELEEVEELIKERSDFDMIFLNYHDVVADPTTELQKLKDNGWPIDVEKAATVPTPDLYRNRL
jgi:hypothetical protein